MAVAGGVWILAGIATQPARAGTILDPINYSVVAADTPGGFSTCSTMSPCVPSGPTSASADMVLLPSDSPDGSPYSGSAIATATFAPVPALLASASITAAQLEVAGDEVSPLSFSAGASLMYYFEMTQIAGVTDSGAVPVLMNGSSMFMSGDGATESLSMTVGTADGVTTLYTLASNNNGGFFQILDILPNVEYEVSMSVFASAQLTANIDSSQSLTAQAEIDPTFTVSPDDAADYALSFSSGIGGEASGVPEPSSGALMLIGFGLGATVVFRRHTSGMSQRYR
jgi:hypothetical protein